MYDTAIIYFFTVSPSYFLSFVWFLFLFASPVPVSPSFLSFASHISPFILFLFCHLTFSSRFFTSPYSFFCLPLLPAPLAPLSSSSSPTSAYCNLLPSSPFSILHSSPFFSHLPLQQHPAVHTLIAFIPADCRADTPCDWWGQWQSPSSCTGDPLQGPPVWSFQRLCSP